eukprot:4802667-Alexandrium_andersonii.AAC.1
MAAVAPAAATLAPWALRDLASPAALGGPPTAGRPALAASARAAWCPCPLRASGPDRAAGPA